jgi:hypothetical protein
VVALLGLGEIHGQDSSYATGVPGANLGGQALNATPGLVVGGTGAPPGTPPLGEPATGTQMSSWIQYPHSGIGCTPLVDGPVTWEIFVRSGVSVNVSGGAMGEALSPGWQIEGGGRSLFFNPEMDEAWTVSVSGSNVRYNRSSKSVTVPRNFYGTPPGPGLAPTMSTTDVTIAGLNRSFANVGMGREWYIMGSAKDVTECSWNIGAEVGFKFGSDNMTFSEIPHVTKDAYGVSGALYSDIEVPYNGAFLTAGVRLEFDSIWSDILQSQNNSNVEDINVLFHVGIRF